MTLDDIDFNKVYFRYVLPPINRYVFQIIKPGDTKESIFRDIFWWDDSKKMVIQRDDQCWQEDFIEIPFIHQSTLEDKFFIIKSLLSIQDIEDRRK